MEQGTQNFAESSSTEDDDEIEDGEERKFSWTFQKKVLLISLCSVYLVAYGSIFVLSPFYPNVVSVLANAVLLLLSRNSRLSTIYVGQWERRRNLESSTPTTKTTTKKTVCILRLGASIRVIKKVQHRNRDNKICIRVSEMHCLIFIIQC